MESPVTTFGPTHYRWRRDIRRRVKRYERRYPTLANNYEGHTGNPALEPSSADFWGLSGRGFPIDAHVGLRLMHEVIRRGPKEPFVYVIHRGVLHWPSGATQPYRDPTDQHFDHVHVSWA